MNLLCSPTGPTNPLVLPFTIQSNPEVLNFSTKPLNYDAFTPFKKKVWGKRSLASQLSGVRARASSGRCTVGGKKANKSEDGDGARKLDDMR
jgi:hypothetical protein